MVVDWLNFKIKQMKERTTYSVSCENSKQNIKISYEKNNYPHFRNIHRHIISSLLNALPTTQKQTNQCGFLRLH